MPLAAESFNYSALDRAKARTKSRVSQHFPQIGRKFNRIGLPFKVLHYIFTHIRTPHLFRAIVSFAFSHPSVSPIVVIARIACNFGSILRLGCPHLSSVNLCCYPACGTRRMDSSTYVILRNLLLLLHVKVVWLAAESFYYGQLDRAATKAKRSMSERFPEIGRKFHRLGLPPKVTFVNHGSMEHTGVNWDAGL